MSSVRRLTPAPSAAATPTSERLPSASAKCSAASASLLPSVTNKISRRSFVKTSSSPIKLCHASPRFSAKAFTCSPLIRNGWPSSRRKQPLRVSPNRQQATWRCFLKLTRPRRTASLTACGLILSCAANSSAEFSLDVIQARRVSRMPRPCL